MKAENVIEKKRVPDCPQCGPDGKKAVYSKRFDASYCPRCGIWLEETCDDPECEFCRQRPDKH